MPYDQSLLNDGEVLALDLKPHWWYFAHHVLTGVVLVIAGILILQTDGQIREILSWVFLAGTFVWLLWVLVEYIQWNYTHFVVTSDRVIFRTGWIAKRGIEIPLERINNINFSQGIWERIIHAGDLEIESAGKDGQSHFQNVRNPDQVQQEIYRQMENNVRKTASYTAAAFANSEGHAAPSVPDQIRQLAELRDQGIISPEEFEYKKADLLNRM
ncbi:MAG: PH domain-containing protein [Acidimicrobiia bacterium]